MICVLQGEEDSNVQQQATGIVLRRKKREDSSPTKAGGALALADMVQKLCQVRATLLLAPKGATATCQTLQ